MRCFRAAVGNWPLLDLVPAQVIPAALEIYLWSVGVIYGGTGSGNELQGRDGTAVLRGGFSPPEELF